MNQLQKNMLFLMKRDSHNPNSLAEAAKTSQPNIFRILEGEVTQPRDTTLRPLADYWGITIADLKYKDLASAATSATAHMVAEQPAKYGNFIIAPVMDVKGSMGNGNRLPDHDAVVGGMQLDVGWVRKNLIISAPSNLAVISGYGNSMEPTYFHGDLLLVDQGVTEVSIDAVYVFTQSEDLFIKTLQRRPGGQLRAISDNKTYEAWDIDAKNHDFRVLGRVVWAWNGKKL